MRQIFHYFFFFFFTTTNAITQQPGSSFQWELLFTVMKRIKDSACDKMVLENQILALSSHAWSPTAETAFRPQIMLLYFFLSYETGYSDE